MFGHHKDHPVAASAKTLSQQEVAHQFDQTNGVMKAFDEYQSGHDSRGALDYDSDETKGKLFNSGAVGGILGRT